MVAAVCAKGADVNLQDWRGQTPFSLANNNRHTDRLNL